MSDPDKNTEQTPPLPEKSTQGSEKSATRENIQTLSQRIRAAKENFLNTQLKDRPDLLRKHEFHRRIADKLPDGFFKGTKEFMNNWTEITDLIGAKAEAIGKGFWNVIRPAVYTGGLILNRPEWINFALQNDARLVLTNISRKGTEFGYGAMNFGLNALDSGKRSVDAIFQKLTQPIQQIFRAPAMGR